LAWLGFVLKQEGSFPANMQSITGGNLGNYIELKSQKMKKLEISSSLNIRWDLAGLLLIILLAYFISIL
jgi:hypothetical protein